MPLGFGRKRGRQSVRSSEEDYYGEDDDGYNDHGVYNGPPPDAFQHGHTGNEFQDGGEYAEEDYGFDGGSQEEGQFAGVTTTAGQLSEEQRQQLQESKVGLTAAERLAMINDTDNINSYQTSIKQKKRQNLCVRCYLLVILAVIGLVVGLYFAFGGPGSDSATNAFREAWRPPSPTPRPTRTPTVRPSASPSATASNNPSALPTSKPSVTASDFPSAMPTSSRPSPLPSVVETESPSLVPSSLPSMMETEGPSLVPSSSQPTTMAPTTAAPVVSVGDAVEEGETDETPAPQVDNNQTDASNAVEGELGNDGDETGGGNDSLFGGGNSSKTANDNQEDGFFGGGQPADNSNGDQGSGFGGDNIFKEGAVPIDCDESTEIVSIYMVDAIGDGWEGAQLAVIEDGDANGSEPIFKDSLAKNEKARGESLCLKTDTCYRIVVDGGMWMNEIRWGIGHTSAQTENSTSFMGRKTDFIESKASFLAPADCTFSLYGACSNACQPGYGENPPRMDEDGNVIEKVANSTAQGAIEKEGGKKNKKKKKKKKARPPA